MAHSILSPSGSKKWGYCPASLGMQLMYPDNSESDYAREGTVAHLLLEKKLNQYKEGVIESGPVGRIFSGYTDFPVTEEMLEHVNLAANLVITMMADHEMTIDNLHVEVKVKIPSVHKECYGTSDIVIIDQDKEEVWVMDYKHGKGVLVNSDDDQLLIYGLGVLDTFDLWHYKKVHTMVLQPRHPGWKPTIKTYHKMELELAARGLKLLAEKAMAEKDNPETFNPGEDQCRWCTASSKCPALEAKVKETLLDEFNEVTPWDEKLKLVPLVKSWIKSVEDKALEYAKTNQISGYKLVETRTNRRWSVPESEAQKLLFDILPLELVNKVIDQKMKSPTQIEKLVRGSLVEEEVLSMMERLVERPPGKLTLAPMSDPRHEAIDQDFADPNI